MAKLLTSNGPDATLKKKFSRKCQLSPIGVDKTLGQLFPVAPPPTMSRPCRSFESSGVRVHQRIHQDPEVTIEFRTPLLRRPDPDTTAKHQRALIQVLSQIIPEAPPEPFQEFWRKYITSSGSLRLGLDLVHQGKMVQPKPIVERKHSPFEIIRIKASERFRR